MHYSGPGSAGVPSSLPSLQSQGSVAQSQPCSPKTQVHAELPGQISKRRLSRGNFSLECGGNQKPFTRLSG